MKRDLSKSQFEYRARKAGFTPEGFWGYWKLSNRSTCVSVLNAGSRRRDQLRYLLAVDKEERAAASVRDGSNADNATGASTK